MGHAQKLITVYNLTPAISLAGDWNTHDGLTVIQHRHAPENYAHVARDHVPNAWFFYQRYVNETDDVRQITQNLRLVFFDHDRMFDNVFRLVTDWPITYGGPIERSYFPLAVLGNHINGASEVHPLNWPAYSAFAAMRMLGYTPQRVPGSVWVIGRDRGRGRELRNQGELVAALLKEDVVLTVGRPGSMTLAQQILRARLADVFIAPHGANVANMVYASPGATLIEVHHPTYYSPWFRDQAHKQGTRYFTGWRTYDIPSDAQGDIDCDVATIVNITKYALADRTHQTECRRRDSKLYYMVREICE